MMTFRIQLFITDIQTHKSKHSHKYIYTQISTFAYTHIHTHIRGTNVTLTDKITDKNFN